MKRTINWYYVYTYRPKHDAYFFERTCGTEEGAQDWVVEYGKRGFQAVYLTNHLIKGAFY